ncbi:hypothetical protein [Umezawaea beigongshangensis]|nr:hypothetical protein [Umezawaea beigongshangensis]
MSSSAGRGTVADRGGGGSPPDGVPPVPTTGKFSAVNASGGRDPP